MRKNELEIMKIIDCLIKNKKLKLTGENCSFYSHFGVKSKNGQYDDSKSIIGYKSINREVKRLCECGIFIKKDNEYMINPQYFALGRASDEKKWHDFVEKLLEIGEFDTYLMLTKYILRSNNENYLNEDDIKTYHLAIKENLENLKADKSVIRDVNYALKNDLGMEIEYKDKSYSVIPICFVISQDGTRTYLYVERKKKLFQPLELRYIKVKRHFSTDSINKSKYKRQIQKQWDIDIKDSEYVKLLYDKKAAEEDLFSEKEVVESMLKLHFNIHSNYKIGNCDYEVYEGEVYGINDLKAWVRRYSKYCLIMEPKALRNEFIKALREKKERYEYGG